MPNTAITRAYEAVYILDPDSGEERVAAIIARYRELGETQGGTVQKAEVWGERRKLAYEIKGRNEGIYAIMQFTGTASVEVELRRVFQISEDHIRYMIVKIDEDMNAQPTAETAAPEAQAAPAPAVEETPAVETTAPAVEAAPITEDAPVMEEETPVPELAAA